MLAHTAPPRLTRELSAVLSALQEGVIVTDVPTQKIVFANAMAARLTGFDDPETLLATPREQVYQRFQFLDARGTPVPTATLPPNRAMKGDHPEPMEVIARGLLNDEEHWTTVSAIPLTADDGAVQQVVTFLRQTPQQHRAERALRFLVKATELLNESLDYQRTLQALAQLVVPELADGCAVFVREDDGSITRVSVYADPKVDQRVKELWGEGVLNMDSPVGPGKVLRTMKPDLVPEYTDELIRQITVDEESAAAFKTIGFRSGLVMPLVARGRPLGMFSLVMTSKGRRFDESDIPFAMELAGRAALAIENARLYRDAQASLLRKDEEVHESERLRRVGNAMIAELEPSRLVQLVTREATAACGAGAGAFLPRAQDGGMSPYAADVPPEALAALPRGRLAPVLDAGQALRVADLAAESPGDPLPPAFPWRSLLAIPIRAEAAEGLGALVLGHPQPGTFTERHERLATALATQASIALANARHVQKAREAEARSRASEERLKLALGAGRMGYYELELHSQRMYCSPEYEALLGFPPGTYDQDAATIFLRMHPDDRKVAQEVLAQSAREGRTSYVIHFRVLHPDGSIHWIESHTRLLRDEKGEPFLQIGIALDITDRKAAEEQSRKLAREQAARAEAEAAQQRISAILESIGEPFFAVDRDWRIRFANRRAQQVLGGLKQEELLSRDARELFTSESTTHVLERCARAYAGEVVEVAQELPDGRWLEVRASAFDQGLSLYVRDITARRRMQDALARQGRYERLRADVGAALASQSTLAETLQRCADALVRHLELGLVALFTVDAPAAMLQLQASTTQSGKPAPRSHFRDLPLEGSHLGHLVRSRRPFVSNDVQRLPGFALKDWFREEGLVAYAGHPLLNGEQPIGVMVLFSARPFPDDVLPTLDALADTLAQGIERRRAEESLKDRADDLARSNSELERFAYVASHDLQEPLRMVASYVQLLARRYQGKLDPDADDFIRFAVEGATRMKRLISDLLTYSRVGTQGKPLVPIRCEVVLGHVLTSLEPVLQECGGEVTADPLPEVLGDEVQLEQLLQNLVSNGLKFHGEAQPKVHISAEQRDEGWVFAVKDNGIGIAQEDFRRLFVLFQRLHGPQEYPGTGIGLAICKKIVERHGGRIWLESAPGKGTTFFFTLKPVVRLEPPPRA